MSEQVVVVTGASGGIGRAVAHAFARRGARVGLLARGARGAGGGRAGGPVARRRGARAADRRQPTPTQVEAAAVAVEEQFGPIDVWVNDAMATVFARFADTRAGRVQARDRGDLPRHRLRHDGRAEADARRATAARSCRSARRCPTARSRCRPPTAARSSRSAASPTRSAPSCWHDRQQGAASRWCSCPGVNTTQFNWCRSKLPDHPMPVPPIYQPEIPAEAVVLGRAAPPPRAVGRLQRRRRDPRQQARAVARRPLPGAHRRSTASRSHEHAGRRPTGPTTSSSPCPAWPRPTASSTARPRRAARSSGRRRTAARSPVSRSARGAAHGALAAPRVSGRERSPSAARPARVRAARRRRARHPRRPARRLRLDVLPALGLRRRLLRADRRDGRLRDHPARTGTCGAATTSPAR